MGEPREALFTSIVEDSADLIVALRDDGTISYMNPAACVLAGWSSEDAVGRSIFDIVHPEDIDRAVLDVSMHSEPGSPSGESTYRVKTADGSWLAVQTTTAALTDGSTPLVATFSRPAEVATAKVLDALLGGASQADALEPVFDMFNRKVFGSRVAITWFDDHGSHHIGTGLPAELTGDDEAADTPWATCRRGAQGRQGTDLSSLDDLRRGLASDLALGAYWIEPVLADESAVCALITVWTREGGPPPVYHSSGMQAAKHFVELILRWTRQVHQLQLAAHHDALTGLPNRKSFFDALGAEDGGAVLYCDLDRLKAVNDELGHAAGDDLLRAVAGRLRATVRSQDLVARIGGDEFAVLCEGASKERAAELAERIRVALLEPFHVAGTIVTVGISIGVAHSEDRLGEEVVDSADRALYRAKGVGGNVVRWVARESNPEPPG